MSKVKVTLTLFVILMTALLWAAAAAPAHPKAPDALRQEENPISYLAALDQSLSQGIDSVNWKKVTWPKL